MEPRTALLTLTIAVANWTVGVMAVAAPSELRPYQ